VTFNGEDWLDRRQTPISLTTSREILQRRTGSSVRQEIEAEHVTDRVAFGLSSPLGLAGSATTRITRRAEAGYQYRSSAFAPTYTAYSVLEDPPADSLRAAPDANPETAEAYLQLPGLPLRIAALADSLTRDLENDYDRARAIESWLKTEFEYTLDLPATAAETSLDYFLFERKAGHCQYFSTAMSIMLRTLGIPTREVTGFLGGEWNEVGGFMSVTQNAAHAWTEVWFPGWGWVTFDPTPPSRGMVTASAAGWSWPAFAFLDGLSYRWSAWVLNFSATQQFQFLERFAGRGSEEGPEANASGDLGGKATLPVGWIVALVVLFGALMIPRTLRFRRRPPAETRAFLRLRRAAEAAGISGAQRVPALELLGRIRRQVPPAYPPAKAVVSTYLVSRFGRDQAPPLARKELSEQLREAVRTLRRIRRPRRRPESPVDAPLTNRGSSATSRPSTPLR